MPALRLRASLNALPHHHGGRSVANLYEDQIHLDLEAGALWQARGDHRWCIIICCRGEVWITQERDVVDYVLQEGEIFIVTLAGRVLVQALKPASVTVVTPSVRDRPYDGDYRIFR
jgi:hypothetical protein